MARRQTAGRGRQGRIWQDGTGNLMLSGWMTIPKEAADVPLLALVAGLACHSACAAAVPSEVAASLRLKWPNDVLFRGAKCAGILLEREGAHIVAGFGVNLAHAPQLKDRQTIALADAWPHGAPQPEDVAQHLIAAWESGFARWIAGDTAGIVADWRRLSIPVGSPVSVQVAGQRRSGQFQGISDFGEMLFRDDDGTERLVVSGEVDMVGDTGHASGD